MHNKLVFCEIGGTIKMLKNYDCMEIKIFNNFVDI